ncbi:MAG: hypothetical protein R3E96_08520 [Planctomycetota bacterium]
MQEVHRLKVQQIHSQALDFYQRAQLALSRRDYDRAVAEAGLAVSAVRSAPYSIDWNGLDKQAEDLLVRAKAERTAANQSMQLEQQQRALAELRATEEAERQRREARVNTMVLQAIDAFEARNYEAAITYADDALRRSPATKRRWRSAMPPSRPVARKPTAATSTSAASSSPRGSSTCRA